MALALAVAALLGVPLFLLGLSLACGLVIAAIEGWTATTGFMYFAGNVTGLGNPLTDVSPENLLSEVMMMVNGTINPPTPCLWQAPATAQKA